MSTYSQVINELRQNNWKTLSNIKTRNLQMGDIESKQLQQQGRLFALAGKFGSELIEKWEDKRKEDAINDANVDWMLNEMDNWAGSDEANEASATLLDNTKKQQDTSHFLGQVRFDEAPSYAIHDAENRTGTYERQLNKLNLTTAAQGYDSWINNQLLKNDNFFIATIDGKQVEIQVNSATKTLQQDVATRNYLRKEYFTQMGINRYTKEFLALSTERGGSGFYASILKADKEAYGALMKQHDIKNSLDKQATTQLVWNRTKTSESFVDMYNALANGVNEKGEAIRNEGAHKFIREQIVEKGIEANQISFDDLVTMANTEVNGFRLGDRWSQYYSVEAGKEGTLVRKYFEAQDELDADENKQGLAIVTEQGDNLIEAINNNKVTSELNFFDAIDELSKLDKGNLYNYDKVFRAWEARNEDPVKVQDAVNKLIDLNKKGKYITDLIESESLSVQNHPIIKDIKSQEAKILNRDDVKLGIKDIRSKFLINPQSIGLRADEYKSIGAFRASQLRIEHFLNQVEAGQEVSTALTQTQLWWKENGGDDDNKYLSEEFTKGNNLGLFATDTSGKYPNVEAQIKGEELGTTNYTGDYAADARTYTVQNKDKEEKALETDQFVKENFGGNYTKALQAKHKITDLAAYQIPAENELFKGDVNYNNLLEQTGMATTWMMEEARRANMSLGEWMNLRQIAHGKEPLKEEFLKYLNEPNVRNLKSGMLNRLNGHTVDGLFRPEEISGDLAKKDNKLCVIQTSTYGNENLGNASQTIHNLPVNNEGDITVSGRDAEGVKNVSCISTAIGATLSDSFAQDFQTGKEYEFTKAISELPKENIVQMWTDPEFGKNMYALTGNLYNLPLEDSLLGSELDMQNKTSILEDLEKWWYTPSTEEEIQENTDVTSETDSNDETGGEAAGLENINDSLKNNIDN